eukprot:682687-Rhodomonas_salina.1
MGTAVVKAPKRSKGRDRINKEGNVFRNVILVVQRHLHRKRCVGGQTRGIIEHWFGTSFYDAAVTTWHSAAFETHPIGAAEQLRVTDPDRALGRKQRMQSAHQLHGLRPVLAAGVVSQHRGDVALPSEIGSEHGDQRASSPRRAVRVNGGNVRKLVIPVNGRPEGVVEAREQLQLDEQRGHARKVPAQKALGWHKTVDRVRIGHRWNHAG